MHITLANLHLATPQQVFDQVARHLLSQEARSVDKDEQCMYRSPDGLQCAAGCLMSDEEYQPKFENINWYSLIFTGCVPDAHSDLISKMQSVHDNWDPYEWRAFLGKMADTFGLERAVLAS